MRWRYRGRANEGSYPDRRSGLVVMTVLTALTSTAGAATTATQWNVTGNGGFVSLDLLNALQLAGGGSEADASSGPVAEAEGTGLCADTAVTHEPVPDQRHLDRRATRSQLHPGRGGQRQRASRRRPPGRAGAPSRQPRHHQRRRLLRHGHRLRGRQRQPDRDGTGSLANVSVSLSLTNVLASLWAGDSVLLSGRSAAASRRPTPRRLEHARASTRR